MVCDNENRVGIAWASGRAPGSSDLHFANSSDGGRSWSTPTTVNDGGAGSHSDQSFHDLALSAKGGLFAAWLDSRPGADSLQSNDPDSGDASVWFARSEDFGAHWGPNAAQWSHASPNSRVSLVVDPGGNLFAAFRKQYSGQIRDVVLARLGGPPVRMREDAWKVMQCPPSGPAMRLSRDGSLRLAWYTGAVGLAGVWFRQSVPELMDSTTAPIPVLTGRDMPIVHIGIAEAGMSGTLIACDADPAGANQLTLVRVEPSGRRVVERFVVPGSEGAAYPRVAAERAVSSAYVVWTSRVGGHSSLRLVRWNLGH